MGISTYCYSQQVNTKNNLYIDKFRQTFRSNQVSVGGLSHDTFIKTNPASKTDNIELERLFPNGEIYKIFNDIVKEYGLKNPPKFVIKELNKSENATNSGVYNTINLNPLSVSSEMYKMQLDQEGKIGFASEESGNLIVLKKDELSAFSEAFNKCGFKVKAVPCTDDEKRKQVIFTLAHELGHSYQYELMAQTEGIDLKKIYLSRSYAREKNLIERKMIEMELNQRFKTNGFDNLEKIYSKTSEKGKFGYRLYNESLHYSQPENNFNEYKNNLLERNADELAFNYLVNHYGDYDNKLIV